MQLEESVKKTNTTTTETSRSELWTLSLRDIFYKYVRFLPLFILSVAFALLIAYLYLRYTIPIYSVSGSMLIRTEQPGSSRNDEIEELLGGTKSGSILNEIEVIKSIPLMQRVVDSLDLQKTYTAKGKIKTVNVYNQGPFKLDALEIFDSSRAFTLKVKFQNDDEFRIGDEKQNFKFGDIFKNEHGVFRLLRNPKVSISKEYSVTWSPNLTAAGNFAGALNVNQKNPSTGILFISMRTTNAKMGADIINKLMSEYALYSIEEKNSASINKLSFIDQRLAEYKYKIDTAQRILNEFERKNNLIDSKSQSESGFQKIGEADKDINNLTLTANVAQMLTDYIQDKRNQFSKVPTTFNITDVTLTELVKEYNGNQIARQQLLDANIPVNNPRVKETETNIEKLRISILENLKSIKITVQSNIATVRGKSQQGQVELSKLPPIVREQTQMMAQLESLQSMYKFMQEEKEKQGIIKAANVANSSIINRAYPTTVPVKPNRRAIQMLAILLGIGLPALVIFLSELLNDKVTTRFDIEKITATPILGEIGHSYSDKVMVVNKVTRSMVAEQFRIIRSNLQYILNKREKSTIIFTSSFSGEGKSYVTTNMGAVLALAGKKCVILEFDIRKPKILSGLNLPKGPGITNFLIGKAELKDLITPVPETENLYVLGCGPIPPNPAELLLDKRMDEMFAWLKENFDIVLVDTAPVGMVSDAMTLSKYADSTIYLVRQGHTFKKQVGLIDEFYKEDKLPKVSIIINDVKIKPGYGYYGYGRYGYGYGYGYGSYYEEEVPPRNFAEKVVGWFDIRRFLGNKPKKRSRSKSRS